MLTSTRFTLLPIRSALSFAVCLCLSACGTSSKAPSAQTEGKTVVIDAPIRASSPVIASPSNTSAAGTPAATPQLPTTSNASRGTLSQGTSAATSPAILPATAPTTARPTVAQTAPSVQSPTASATRVTTAPTSPVVSSTPLARAPATSATAPVATAVAAPTSGSGYRLPEGVYRCDEGKRVLIKQVSADGRNLILAYSGRDIPMNFVPANSGALRFENVRSHLVWVVSSDKAMLLDSKAGGRLANQCKL